MIFSVYILYSEIIDKYYVGHTDNIERRLHEHNSGQTRYTSIQGKPWKIVYKEEYQARALAMTREREIKSKKSRKYIESLVEKGL
jgi:putative endonuclease